MVGLLMADNFRILVIDGVSQSGVDLLNAIDGFEVTVEGKQTEDELVAKIGDYHALALRSATKVTRKVLDAATNLKAIGRAGVGYDNIDHVAATEKGIVVMNTPGGNTISTAELAFSMMLASSRNIPQADASVKAGKWERKHFLGTEVYNKALGIVGMGRIGSEFARRAIAFGMRVVAYDPYLSLARARSMQVELFEDIEEMLPECDFVTLHMPMTPETKGIINLERMKKCKDSVRFINCARGGLIDEEDLVTALNDGIIGGAALDVYTTEPIPEGFPLLSCPNLVMTPHLGASTAEAQENVGIEIAECIRDLLVDGTIRNAVNVPNVDSKTLEVLRPWLEIGDCLGSAAAQLSPSRCDSLTVQYSGQISESDTTAVTRAALKGFLRHSGGSDVNEVNAPSYAKNHGLQFSETRSGDTSEFSELVTVEVKAANGEVCEVSGTYFGTEPRIVKVNGFNLEAKPKGTLLIMENEDRPGIIGWIGTLLAKHEVNIARMSLSRSGPGSNALSILNIDSEISEEVKAEILEDKRIIWVKVFTL